MPDLILKSTFVEFDSPDLLLFTTLTYEKEGLGSEQLEPLALWLLRHWAPDLGLPRVLWWTLGRCWAGAEAASLVWDHIHWGQGVCGQEGLGIMVQRQNFQRPCTRAVGPHASQHAHPNEGSSRVQEASRGADRALPSPGLSTTFPLAVPSPSPCGRA